MAAQKFYLAIDLKSYYASAECKARGLDPMTTNLVVADESRTEKTICLAVSPALKACGIPGRPRLFEVTAVVDAINRRRLYASPQRRFTGTSCDSNLLRRNKSLQLSMIVAPPRMSYYVDLSAKIYSFYLSFFSKEDIHIYSIDECFIDLTNYLSLYRKAPLDLAEELLQKLWKKYALPATAGVGTNLYLAKIALDIRAKKLPSPQNGLAAAQLDERSYREFLWEHRPLTDFWQIGRGLARKLAENGMKTMGDIARCSLDNEKLLYKLFGINAELLIDHAWGMEPCTMAAIKNYKAKKHSLCSGQVLHRPYSFSEGRIVLTEMLDALALDLAEKGLRTDSLTLHAGYDVSSLQPAYTGSVCIDSYGRRLPVPAHGTVRLGNSTCSTSLITTKGLTLYDRIVNRQLFLRRFTVTANNVLPEQYCQPGLFSEDIPPEKERQLQQTLINIKRRFGNNAVMKAVSLSEGATGAERNRQIGGHKA